MKILSRLALSLTLALLIATPGFAATADVEATVAPMDVAEVAPAEASELTVEDLEALVTPQKSQNQADCSAWTPCHGGSSVSCTGWNFCAAEPWSWVVCDGVRYNCPNPPNPPY